MLVLCAGLVLLGLTLSTQAAAAEADSRVAKPAKKPDWTLLQEGVASFYPGRKKGKYGKHLLTAASRVLPFGTKVTVTHQKTGKSVVVVVNDRGPALTDRVVDLSAEAAKELGFMREGLATVRIEARPSEQPAPAVREALTQLAHAQ